MEGTNEEAERIHAALINSRNDLEGTIRDTFVRGVNNYVDLGNPSIALVPQTLIGKVFVLFLKSAHFYPKELFSKY